MSSVPLSVTRTGERRRALRRIGDDGHDIPKRNVLLGRSAEVMGRPPSSVRKLVRQIPDRAGRWPSTGPLRHLARVLVDH